METTMEPPTYRNAARCWRPTGFALVGDEVTEADDVDGELVSELNSFSSTPALLKSHA